MSSITRAARFRIALLIGSSVIALNLPIGARASHTIQAQSAELGNCPVFPADNAWNQDISGLLVDAKSATYIGSMGAATHIHPDFGSDLSYGIPYVVVSGTQEKVPINFTDFGDESDPGPYPIPANAMVEGNGTAGDQHVIAVDKDNCKLYELYSSSYVGPGWIASSGAVFDLRSDARRPDGWTSADAAGLPIFAGLIRYSEVVAGVIPHAIRMTANHVQRAYIYPATHYAGNDTNPNDPPMGLRIRLKASFDISSYNPTSKVILTAFKKYGLIMADIGSDWFFSGGTDARWDDKVLNQLKQVPGSAFEVVQAGTIHY